MRVIAETTGMRWVCVAKVTADKWTLCAVHDGLALGLVPGDCLAIEDTFCDQVRKTNKGVVIDSVSDNPAYLEHPITKMFGFQSYFSLPVYRADGTFFGTLCGLDHKTVRVSDPKILDMIGLFAEILSSLIDADVQLRDAENALQAERETVDLREQFIAVLGHDIRNPLSSIMSGAEILATRSQNEGTLDVARRIKRSAARIATLIDDVMDFARSKLGGGLPVSARAAIDLGAALGHVVAELRDAYPQCVIASRVDIRDPVFCDSARISQLLSNLLANAIVHGRDGAQITVDVFGMNGGVTPLRGELRASDPARDCGAPLPALPARPREPGTRRVGLGPLHCIRDRKVT